MAKRTKKTKTENAAIEPEISALFGEEGSPDEFPGGIPEVVPDISKYAEFALSDGAMKKWKPASEVFDTIESVRTCLPGFNMAVRVGGLPVRRIHTVHGPTHGGKTAFVLALVKSFVTRGFLSGYVDAEHSLGQEFAQEMVADLQRYPNFMALRPENYEETIEATSQFLARSAEVAEKFKSERPKSIIVVDSINKLVPKRELAAILKAGEVNAAGATELAKGHHGRARAALNQAWLDHLTPRVARAECAMVVIAQEREEDDPADFFANNFKVKGGAALLFDASLVMRVQKGTPVWPPGVGKDDKKTNDMIQGFKHTVRIYKSKVGHMDGRFSEAVFHLSNGKLTPRGLDLARDAFTIGAELGVLKTAGSWYSFEGKRWQGENAVVQGLVADQPRLNKLLDGIAFALDVREGRASAADTEGT